MKLDDIRALRRTTPDGGFVSVVSGRLRAASGTLMAAGASGDVSAREAGSVSARRRWRRVSSHESGGWDVRKPRARRTIKG